MITTYATLQSEVADWLNRSDLTNVIKTFVQLAENEFNRDPRLRRMIENASFVADADAKALPADLIAIEALYHDGGTYFGPIEIVGAEQLAHLKLKFGTTGPPRYAARILASTGTLTGGTLRFAPVPDAAYTLKLSYWAGVVALSDAAPTNWLVTNHPDIYLYGALVESAPYLKDDARLQVWRFELERRLESLHLQTDRAQFSGTLVRRPSQVFGG